MHGGIAWLESALAVAGSFIVYLPHNRSEDNRWRQKNNRLNDKGIITIMPRRIQEQTSGDTAPTGSHD
jgi:hypothetical protein